jgi:integral membrane protein
MPFAPKKADIPRIPGALKFYKVMSYITGTFLLLLAFEMILKYCIDARSWAFVWPGGAVNPETGEFVFYEPGFEIEMFGSNGFLALVPSDTVEAINISLWILIIHGWLYVIYLFAGFRIWSMMRWPMTKFLIIALGGIIPGLSFYVEAKYAKIVEKFLEQQKTSEPEVPPAKASA